MSATLKETRHTTPEIHRGRGKKILWVFICLICVNMLKFTQSPDRVTVVKTFTVHHNIVFPHTIFGFPCNTAALCFRLHSHDQTCNSMRDLNSHSVAARVNTVSFWPSVYPLTLQKAVMKLHSPYMLFDIDTWCAKFTDSTLKAYVNGQNEQSRDPSQTRYVYVFRFLADAFIQLIISTICTQLKKCNVM